MAQIDLRLLPDDEVVLHFGGRLQQIDAFTFSRSLISFADALQEINRQLQPELAVDVTLDGAGPGSFRAKVKTKRRSIGGLWRTDTLPGSVLAAVLATIICQKVLAPDPSRTVTVTEDMVVIEQGDDTIIVSRNAWDATQRLPRPEKVDGHISSAFAAMEQDPSVTEFGLTPGLADGRPLAVIPREAFPLLASPVAFGPPDQFRRYSDEPARLTVVKAVFQRGRRKWEFIWRGLKISASISDESFFERLKLRELWLAQGDELDATLRIHQQFDELHGVYVNVGYEVISVGDVVHRERQQRLPGH